MGGYLSVEDENQTESDTINTQQSTEILQPKLNTKSNSDKINTATNKKKNGGIYHYK